MNTKELLTITQRVLPTLPLSHYIRVATIKVTLDLTAKTSYFDPQKWEIVVSFNNICENAKNSNPANEEEAENIVRNFLYHETSHAILTPADLFTFASQYNIGGQCLAPALINIVEDERIETILKGYYNGVDFKANIRNTCPLNPLDSYTSFTGFVFNALRLRYAPSGLMSTIEPYIDRFVNCTKVANAGRGNADFIAYCAHDLLAKLYPLWQNLNQQNQQPKNQPQNGRDTTGQDGQGEGQDGQGNGTQTTAENDRESGMSDGQGTQTEENGENQSQSQKSKQGKQHGTQHCDSPAEESEEEAQAEESALTQEQIEEIRDLLEKAIADTEKSITGKTRLSTFVASEKAKGKMLHIIGKNTGFGVATTTAIKGYGGKFSPKAMMTDFNDSRKWFKKTLDNGGLNSRKGQKKTLNIWLDNSGSFSHNDKAVNKILKALAEIEKSRDDFAFNLVRIEEGLTLKQGEDRVSVSGGGTSFFEFDLRVLYKRLNPTGQELNIVLFDGDIGSYCRGALSVFNNRKCSIITEQENLGKRKCNSIDSICPKAREIIIENTDYPKALEANIIKAMEALF